MLGVTVIRGHHWNARMAPHAEQGLVCPPGSLGGRWRWTLATFEVSAFSRRRVSELGGPRCSISNAPPRQSYFVFFFFLSLPQRYIANEAPVSELRSDFGTLVSGFSSHCRDFISLLSFLQREDGSKGFWNLFFFLGWFKVSQNIFEETTRISDEWDLFWLFKMLLFSIVLEKEC